MLDKSAQTGSHTFAERGDDVYSTPDVAVYALMKCEQLPEVIWEPACGEGSIVKILRAAGHTVYASDINNFGCGQSGVDFLTTDLRPPVSMILTNPPYKFAAEFIERGLAICPKVVVLLRLAFYESQKRSKLLEESGLARIHVFRNRLPMMHRKDWDGPKASSGMPFAWYVWERGHKGPTIIDRISWEKPPISVDVIKRSDSIIYLNGHICDARHKNLGFILTPDMGNLIPDNAILAADNGCFSNPKEYTDARYMAYLRKFPKDRTLFATAVDVLGDHVATVKRAIPMLRAIRQLGLPAAFVAQDGWDEATTPWDECDAIFIGGSTKFKFNGGVEAIKAAKKRGKWAHMGRVNSLRRFRASAYFGCDSVDGTYLKFGPNTNLPTLLSWFDAVKKRDVR